MFNCRFKSGLHQHSFWQICKVDLKLASSKKAAVSFIMSTALDSLQEDDFHSRARFERSLQEHKRILGSLDQLEHRIQERLRNLAKLQEDVIRFQTSSLEDSISDSCELLATHSSQRSFSLTTPACIDSPVGNSQRSQRFVSNSNLSSEPNLSTRESVIVESAKGPQSRPLHAVTFAEPDEEYHVQTHWQEVKSYPVHGHWVPPDMRDSRLSFQAASALEIGGRQTILPTPGRLGTVPCVIVEPMGKLLDSKKFVSTGILIIFHGAQNSLAVVQEWAQILKRTKILDAGFSMVLPDLSQAQTDFGADGLSVKDIEDIVVAVLALSGCDCCFLCAKASSAQHVIRLAATTSGSKEHSLGQRVEGRIAGVLIWAPTTPPPQQACAETPGPVMLVWAKDDTTALFRTGAPQWAEALDARSALPDAATVFRDPRVGGHDLGRVYRKNDRVALDTLQFLAAAGLMFQLSNLNLDITPHSELPDSILRLCDELPESLTGRLLHRLGKSSDFLSKDEEHAGLAATFWVCCGTHGSEKCSDEFVETLLEWLRQDMPGAVSSSE